MKPFSCNLKNQDLAPGSCSVRVGDHLVPACQATLKKDQRKLEPEQILSSPQGFGPARNIVAFTGGDLTCRPEFYAQCAALIKTQTRLWTLIETNGYGLTAHNLDLLQTHGVDAFWLDIKAIVNVT